MDGHGDKDWHLARYFSRYINQVQSSPPSPLPLTSFVDYTTQSCVTPFVYEGSSDVDSGYPSLPQALACVSFSPSYYLDSSASSQVTNLSPGIYDHESQPRSQDIEVTAEHLAIISSQSPQSSSPTEPSTAFSEHHYRSISNELRSADKWLRCSKVNGKRAYQCLWDCCAKEPFGRRVRARIHVLGHLRLKLFECSCGKQFTTRSAVKRHCDSHTASFPCAVCQRYFTRKYNRNLHQQQCSLQVQL